MKFKKLTAVLLSAATLAAMPVTPVVRDVWQDTAITAEAADGIIAYINVSKILYAIYQKNDTNKTRYAVAIGSETNITNVVLPATVTYDSTAVPVTEINNGCFSGRYNLGKVDLSKAVNLTRIGQNAFASSNVTEVTIGSKLTVEKNAFTNTNSLQKVTVTSKSGKITIQGYAFDRSAIKEFHCSSRLVAINAYAFYQAISLNTVHFYSQCTSLSFGSAAFRNLYNLTNFTIDNKNASMTIYTETFANCGIKSPSVALTNNVRTIPKGCFSGCQFTSFTLPASVTTLSEKAFASAILPKTVTIGKNVTSIADDAFMLTQGVEEFKVESGNTKFKADVGVLYNNNYTKLINYPQARSGSGFTTSAKEIPDYAFANNENLVTLTIRNYTPRKGDTGMFPGLKNLENLNVSTSLDGDTILARHHYLFSTVYSGSKLHKINNSELLYTPSGKEPYFNSKYTNYICRHFDEFEGSNILKTYTDKMEDWVVETYAPSSLSPIQRILRLRKWIMDRTQYDPGVINNDGSTNEMQDHGSASVFLHKEPVDGKEKYVTVCEGYARCYTNLLNKAGIEAKTVWAAVHAWNIVKLNGKWYQMDICWDDLPLDYPADFGHLKPYGYCMVTDSVINTAPDGHSGYNWTAGGSLKKGNNVATTDISKLGDVDGNGKFTSADVSKLKTYINTTNAKYIALCDLNFDGKVTSADATLLQNYVNTYYKSYATPRLWRFAVYEKY